MKEITSAQFDSEVLHCDVPVLVDFYTEHCHPCRQMSPLLDQVEQESGGALKVVKIDAAAEGQFTASFHVVSVPTFVLFHRGQRLAQLTGARSKKQLTKWLEETIQRPR